MATPTADETPRTSAADEASVTRALHRAHALTKEAAAKLRDGKVADALKDLDTAKRIASHQAEALATIIGRVAPTVVADA